MALSKFAKEDVCPECGAGECRPALNEFGYMNGPTGNKTICTKFNYCDKCKLLFRQRYSLHLIEQEIARICIPVAKPL